MLMTALFLDNQLKAAEDVASAGIERDNEDTTALAMRGYLRQRQGKTGPANADFDEAMAQDWLDDDQRRNVRLIAADAALAAGERARATQLLAPLDGNDEAVARRRKQALSAERPPATLTLSNYPPPAQDCHDTPYGTLCELLPFDAAVGGGPSALAYAAFARHDYQEAIVQAGKAVEQDPGSADKQRLLTTVLASGTDAQAAQASQRLQQAMVATPNDPDLLMQNGYLQQRLGHPDLALQSFEAARATGKAPATSILDLAYAQSAAGDKRAAVQSLKSAIDQADAGTLDLDPQRRFDTRSAISGLSREWGGYVSAGYRGARPATTGLAGTTPSIPGDAVSNTAEIFWRPANFGNSATRVLEAYGRLSNTLYDSGSTTRAQDIADPCSANSTLKVAGTTSGSVAGVPSTVGSLGVRFTPSTTAGLTFGIERQFLLGTATRTGSLSPSDQNLRCSLNGSNKSAQYKADAGSGGWLTYVTYGFYEGSGYRLDTPSWFTMTGYAQAGYSWQDLPAHFWLQDNTTQARSGDVSGTLKRNQAFAASEVRAGRSYRMDIIDEHLVLFPHFVVAADWLSQRNSASAAVLGGTGNVSLQGNGSSWSLGAGPGVNMRYWFREDHYNAQRSYVDLTVQYRVNIGGGDASRAKGLFMSLTLSY
jgi:tetratricopeptide (TPR) repeat protein